jgi:polyhydroxyalkanoate synthesis regulator phasin
MKTGKEITQKLSALLEKLQAGYRNIEQQMNTEFTARDARIAELEERITALEAQA